MFNPYLLKLFFGYTHLFFIPFFVMSLFFCENNPPKKPKKAENLKIETPQKETQKTADQQKENVTQKMVIDTPQIQKVACEKLPHFISKELKNTFLEAKKDQKKPLIILCYGNSITQGYKVGTAKMVANPYPKVLENLLKKDIPQTKTLNQGHNGWRTDHAIKNIQKEVLDKKPTIVLLDFGINDAYSSFSGQLFQKNMLFLINSLKNQNIIPLILTPTPIFTQYAPQVENYCEILQKISTQHQISFINLQKEITQRAITEKISPKNLLPDDIHFADEYYAWIAEIIAKEIN